MTDARSYRPARTTVGAVFATIGVVAAIVGVSFAFAPGRPAACSQLAGAIGGIYFIGGVLLILLSIVGIGLSISGLGRTRRLVGRTPAIGVVAIVVCSLFVPVLAYVGFVGVISFGFCITF